jgi:hypothetical protein
MIPCPVCNAPNHHLAVVCVSCHGFLQGRTENLDLFSTTWEVIERPGRALHMIALARHKNYALFLSAAGGIAMAFALFWLMKAGEVSGSLLNILAAGLLAGPLFGVIILLLTSGLAWGVARVFRLRMTFRNTFATFSYSLVPVVLSMVCVLPIEILTFGQFFFTRNPSPALLKPGAYYILLSLDALFLLWTLILQQFGLRVLLNAGWVKTLLVQCIPLGILAGLLSWGISVLLAIA